MRSGRLELLILLFLIVSTFAVYWQVIDHDFINLDDNLYITENRNVLWGVNKNSIIWAFTTFHSGNWHPLTWLSHMVDCELFWLDAGKHHLVSLLFHMANSVLLFLVFRRMTGALWRSGFVAALFALHPLHVESVAWVSERKDVLSTFFWFLTMWAYVGYAARPRFSRYILVLIFFILGLMSKPMVVTLPFVLLLMDFWPLGRVRLRGISKKDNAGGGELGASWLVYEKVPLFILAGISCLITYFSEAEGAAVRSLKAFPLQLRIANTLVSYVEYIGKMIWPQDLAVLYPHPGDVPMWESAGAALLLMCLSVVFIRKVLSRPHLTVGWFWYLGTLIPVIGLVQVGTQSMADRYTYIPLIGLFIMISWGIPEQMGEWRYSRVALLASSVLVLSALMVTTWLQIRHWKDSVSLLTHTVNITADNSLAHNNLGIALEKEGRYGEAIHHYSEALRIKPDFAMAHNNLGCALLMQGDFESAISHYSKALRIEPEDAAAHYNLGIAFERRGDLKSAISHYSKALRIRPDYQEAKYSLRLAIRRQMKVKGAK